MEAWKRRLTALVAALGAVGVLMSSAEAREPRRRDDLTPPTLSPGSSVTFPTFPTTTPPPTMPPPTTATTTPPPTMPPPTSSPTTTPPPTMPPGTLPPNVNNQIEDIIDTLEQFGDEFQDIIDFLSNPFGI